MRARAILGAALCLAAAPLGCDSPPQSVRVSGPEERYAFRLPARFFVVTPGDGVAKTEGREVTYSDGSSLVIVFSTPRPQPDGYAKLTLKAYRDAVVEQLRRDVPEFTLTEEARPIDFGGRPGYALKARGLIEGRASAYEIGLGCDEERCYQLTVWAPSHQERSARALLRDALASWRITPIAAE